MGTMGRKGEEEGSKLRKRLEQYRKYNYICLGICLVILLVGGGLAKLAIYLFQNSSVGITVNSVEAVKKMKGMQEAQNLLYSMDNTERLQYFEEKAAIREANLKTLEECPYSRAATIDLFFSELDSDRDNHITRDEFARIYPIEFYPVYVLKCGYTYFSMSTLMKHFCFKNCESLTEYNQDRYFDFT